MKKYVKNYGHIDFEKKPYLLPLSSQSDFLHIFSKLFSEIEKWTKINVQN